MLDADEVLMLTLNRPARRNAFTPVTCAESIDAFGAGSRDDAVPALLVIGAGRTSRAGMDLAISGYRS